MSDGLAAQVMESMVGISVLVADDMLFNRKFIIAQMKQIAGSTFIEVATAEEVLLHVAKQDFDLLLIDEEMPLLEDSSKDAMLGSQAISEIRRRESVEHNKNSNMNHNRSRRLRIVSCTSRSSEPVVSSRIMAAGADLLWGKPFPGRTEMYNTLSKLFA